jgi:hypothetical protein
MLQIAAKKPTGVKGHFGLRHSAHQKLGQLCGRHVFEPRAQLSQHPGADFLLDNTSIQNPVTRDWIAAQGCEQIVKFQYFDAALAHRPRENVVVFHRLVDPDDIVEQEGCRVGGSQPPVREARTADHHRAQLARFRMNAQSHQ